jgi:hypothetical protein
MFVTINIPDKNLEQLLVRVSELEGERVDIGIIEKYEVPKQVKEEVLRRLNDNPEHDISLEELKAEFGTGGI